MGRMRKWCFLLCVLPALAGCITKPLILQPYNIESMPPPIIYDNFDFTPFSIETALDNSRTLPLLYATTRKPAETGDSLPFYLNERGQVLRLGKADIRMVNPEDCWDDLTRFGEPRLEESDYALYVNEVKEYGILRQSVSAYIDLTTEERELENRDSLFLQELNYLLNRNEDRDIFIFVHGFNENFENPLLMTSQFWHYLGYRGAFISYGWPSFHRETAYVGDLDTAMASARTFRLFLQYLAENTDAHKIHIIGYSAGTRLVTQTLNQISLLNKHLSARESRARTKLGSLILLASDMDRELFGTYLLDGLMKTVEQIDIYVSEKDQLLKASHAIHNNPRLGEKWEYNMTPPALTLFLESQERLHIIDVSDAVQIDTRGGHFYFLDSPWVSSDFLTTLYTGAHPRDRGLVKHRTLPYWTFPGDYSEKSRKAILEFKEEQLRNQTGDSLR